MRTSRKYWGVDRLDAESQPKASTSPVLGRNTGASQRTAYA